MDLVLISKTKHGLQLGMNVFYEFCSANTLTVNTNKSEVMYVSKRKPTSLPAIHYNNMLLRWVNSFRYLGVNIHRTNNLNKESSINFGYAHFISLYCFSKSYFWTFWLSNETSVNVWMCCMGFRKHCWDWKVPSAVYETNIKGQDDYKLLCSICGDREVPSLCFH